MSAPGRGASSGAGDGHGEAAGRPRCWRRRGEEQGTPSFPPPVPSCAVPPPSPMAGVPDVPPVSPQPKVGPGGAFPCRHGALSAGARSSDNTPNVGTQTLPAPAPAVVAARQSLPFLLWMCGSTSGDGSFNEHSANDVIKRYTRCSRFAWQGFAVHLIFALVSPCLQKSVASSAYGRCCSSFLPGFSSLSPGSARSWPKPLLCSVLELRGAPGPHHQVSWGQEGEGFRSTWCGAGAAACGSGRAQRAAEPRGAAGTSRKPPAWGIPRHL